jgi:VWFA-related protein
MRTKWLLYALAALSIWSISSTAWAQKDLFLDAVEVKVASVEVVVEDKDGNKISGLTAADFQLFEDGAAQQIEYFTAQENGQAKLLGSEEEEAPAANAMPTTERVHMAVFIDDVHLSQNNRNLVFGRLKEYLESSLKPSDLVMIARLSDRLVIEQPFTADVAALNAALDRLATRAGSAMQMEAQYQRIVTEIVNTSTPTDEQEEAGRGGLAQSRMSGQEVAKVAAASQAREIVAFSEERRIRVLGTIKALESAVGSLAGLPGRKALVYLSDGLPVRAAAGLSEIWRDKYEQWAMQNGERDILSELTRASSMSIEAENQLKAMTTTASAAKVAFYVLSPGGKVGRSIASAEMRGTTSGGSFRGNATEAFENEQALFQLAEATGGKALTRNTDIASLLEDVRDDFGTFYSLGYKPQAEAKDGNRKIVVKVRDRPDAKVRYTHTLGDMDPIEQLREMTLSALYHGLSDNPLKVEIEPKPATELGGDKYRVDMMIKIPFEKVLLLPREESHVGRLSLFVIVQDKKSQNLSTMSRIELPLNIPNEQVLQVMAQKAAYPLKLEMQGGPQRMAIGIRDHLSKTSATIEIDLDVPDTMAAVPPPEAADADAPAPVGGAE